MIDERRTCMRLQSHSCCCSVAAFHSCCEIAVMFGQNQKLTCMFQNILTSNALHSDKQITGYCWWSIRRYMQAAVERYLRQGPVGGKGDDDYDDDELMMMKSMLWISPIFHCSSRHPFWMPNIFWFSSFSLQHKPSRPLRQSYISEARSRSEGFTLAVSDSWQSPTTAVHCLITMGGEG